MTGLDEPGRVRDPVANGLWIGDGEGGNSGSPSRRPIHRDRRSSTPDELGWHVMLCHYLGKSVARSPLSR
jgi:hypothetical protein